MKKTAQVISVSSDGMAELRVKRDSACGDCATCGGCDAGSITFSVKNTLDAKPGDTVSVETPSKAVIAVAALVYLLPLLLFFAGYAIGSALRFSPVLLGGIGFAASLLTVILCSKKISAKIGYHMTGYSEDHA